MDNSKLHFLFYPTPVRGALFKILTTRGRWVVGGLYPPTVTKPTNLVEAARVVKISKSARLTG